MNFKCPGCLNKVNPLEAGAFCRCDLCSTFVYIPQSPNSAEDDNKEFFFRAFSEMLGKVSNFRVQLTRLNSKIDSIGKKKLSIKVNNK